MQDWAPLVLLMFFGGGILGSFVLFSSPDALVRLAMAVFENAILPVLTKQMSPEDLAAYHEWIRQGQQGQFHKPSDTHIDHAGENH